MKNTFKNHCYLLMASLLLSIATPLAVQAQESDRPLEEVVKKVDTKANYPGGMVAFYHYFNNALDIDALNLDKDVKMIKIVFSFNVEIDGTITDITITKGDLGEIANNILIETFINAEKWQPALLDDKPVKSNSIFLFSKKLE